MFIFMSHIYYVFFFSLFHSLHFSCKFIVLFIHLTTLIYPNNMQCSNNSQQTFLSKRTYIGFIHAKLCPDRLNDSCSCINKVQEMYNKVNNFYKVSFNSSTSLMNNQHMLLNAHIRFV